MRITISTNDTALTFMRRAGYGLQKEAGGEIAFVRRVSGSPFPRYHAYVTEQQGMAAAGQQGRRELTINLHVDQKAPTYGRGSAHSGEYDGPLIQQECDRLRALAQSLVTPPPAPKPPEEKKGFFGRLFG